MCPAHTFETTYFGSLNKVNKGHEILKSTFAMDLTSLDMVVGGSIMMSDDDENEKLFLYLAQESTCTVPWNFFENREGDYHEWDGLALRSA